MSSIWSKLINLAGNITGTLPVANGGTGVTTSTGTGSVVLGTSPTLTTSTVWSGTNYTFLTDTGAGSDLSNILIASGGGTGATRSATLQMFGDDVATFGGQVYIAASSASTASATSSGIIFQVAATAGGALATVLAITGTRGTKITGTQSNDDAAAGIVGQYLETKTASTSVGTSGQFFDAGTLTLTAGDWDVQGTIYYSPNGATITSPAYVCGIGSATGNSGTNIANGQTAIEWDTATAGGITNATFVTPTVRIKSDGTDYSINGNTVSASQVVYLKGFISTYSVATPKYVSVIRARRMR